MVQISRSERRSGLVDVLYGYGSDRLIQRVKIYIRNLLIYSILLTFHFGHTLKSQITNELAFDSILIGFLTPITSNYSKVTGFLTQGLEAELKGKLKGEDSLRIEEPRIELTRTEDGLIARSMEVDLVLDFETGETKTILFKDTLDRAGLRSIRSTKYPPLKGEHPSPLRRYVFPALGLAAGVGTIVSLFYIRSR